MQGQRADSSSLIDVGSRTIPSNLLVFESYGLCNLVVESPALVPAPNGVLEGDGQLAYPSRGGLPGFSKQASKYPAGGRAYR